MPELSPLKEGNTESTVAKTSDLSKSVRLVGLFEIILVCDWLNSIECKDTTSAYFIAAPCFATLQVFTDDSSNRHCNTSACRVEELS